MFQNEVGRCFQLQVSKNDMFDFLLAFPDGKLDSGLEMPKQIPGKGKKWIYYCVRRNKKNN